MQRVSTYHSHRGRLELAQAYYFLRKALDHDLAKEDNPVAPSFFLDRLEQFIRVELRGRPKLQEQILEEQHQQWQWLKAHVTPGKRYPRTFLTPPDTKACDLMKRDSEENRLTIKRYQKEILALAKEDQAPQRTASHPVSDRAK